MLCQRGVKNVIFGYVFRTKAFVDFIFIENSEEYGL